MSVEDWVFIAVVLGLAALWLLVPSRFRAGAFAVIAALVAAVVAVLVVEGPIWQLAPAAPLIFLLAIAAWRGWRIGGWWRRTGVLVLVMAALGPWLVAPPVPRLPAPSGELALGSRILRWVDPDRPEPATADANDHRNVVAQLWYPAQPGAVGEHSAYIDGVDRLPPAVSLFPGFMMRRYDRIDTHALEGAPISNARTWPVVLFSPGYGAPRAAYTGLLTELASRGYLVVALDHPYESAVVQLADGRLALPAPIHGDVDAYMIAQEDTRAADIVFALDRLLADPRLAGRIDPDRIYAIGHSFGGPSAVLAMTRDPRIKAAANLDGTPYGTLPDQSLDRPFLLIESDPAETHHGQTYLAGNAKLLANATAPVRRLTIRRANHYSFTDAYLFLAPPARWALSRIAGGERGPKDTQRTAADRLQRFLDGATQSAFGRRGLSSRD